MSDNDPGEEQPVSHWPPGLHYKEHCQQVKGGDLFPLLSPGGTHIEKSTRTYWSEAKGHKDEREGDLPVGGWLNTCRGCPEQLQSVHPWRYSEEDWAQSQTTCSS